MNSTIGEIESQVKLSRNSFVANANGIFYFLAYMSSLYHLLLLSLSRLYAIKWPFKYRELTNKTVYYGIGIVWVLAAIVASAPGTENGRICAEYFCSFVVVIVVSV